MTEKVADSIKFLMSTYERLLRKQKDGKLTKSELETNCVAALTEALAIMYLCMAGGTSLKLSK